jgi:hypothetical protein
MIHRLGGTVIRVKRDVVENQGSHISETLIDTLDADYEIENNGTIEELHDKVNTVAAAYGGGSTR